MPIYPTGKKRKGQTQYRVRINYTEGGEYLQKEQLCYGYREAVETEERLRIQYADGNRADMLLRDFFEEYVQLRQSNLRETSLAKLNSLVQEHVLPTLGDYSLGDLSSRVLANWQASLCAKGYKHNYLLRIYSALNGMLNYAAKMKYIPENPTKNLEKIREVDFSAPDEKIHYYTAEEFLRFQQTANLAIHNYYERSVYMFLVIAYYTGMRKGEIHALRWSDLCDGTIRVRRSISQKVKGKSAVETAPKNKASVRTLQIPIPLQTLLDQYIILQKSEFLENWSPDFKVIYGPRCISDTGLSNFNKAWAKAASLEPIRIHDYRHSHASLLANEGINIQEIARRLGHADVKITWQTYAHLYPREEERALAVLNRVVVASHEFPTNNP